tara:strand:+ start:46 stop:717 length:672 start_codon:yes stop_codon:yes gene_type:complete
MAEKNYLSTVIMGLICAGSVAGLSLGTFGWEGPLPLMFLACSTGCCFFYQILIVTGIMTVTIGDEVAVVSQGSDNEKPTYDYRNYHYKSIITSVQASQVLIKVTSVEDAIKTYSSLFNVGEKAARPFFQNQFVMTTLGLNIESSSQVPDVSPSRQNKTNKISPNFWDNVAEGVAKNEAKSDEICADPNCSKPVSAFDFRCFKCRSRFCADCETGKSIMCKSCS